MIRSLNTTSSEQSNDTVRCWIVQHIADSFRKESRNVGVIVQREGVFGARFVGESSELEFDDRKLRFLAHPKVYRNWVRYWRRLIQDQEREIDVELSADQDGNFRVIDGGAISRSGADSIETICEYAYSMLVSHGGLSEALHTTELGEEPHLVLRESIAREFRSSGLMGGSQNLFGRNPIVANQSIVGNRTVHEFSFTQRHATLDLIEPLNLRTTQKRHAKDRAGWMAYAFNDVQQSSKRECEIIPIVIADIPEKRDDVTEYCLDTLKGLATIINWDSHAERERFLSERQAAAV